MRRALTSEERDELFARYYRPHHPALTRALQDELAATGAALIIDAHSFPERPWVVEPHPNARRPDFCIGSDPFHTPREFVDRATELLESRGFSVLENEPYGGSLVPLEFYRREARVRSIMIQVNRRICLGEPRPASGIPEREAVFDLIAELREL